MGEYVHEDNLSNVGEPVFSSRELADDLMAMKAGFIPDQSIAPSTEEETSHMTHIGESGIREYPKREDGSIIMNAREGDPQSQIGGYHSPDVADVEAARRIYANGSVTPISDKSAELARDFHTQRDDAKGLTPAQREEAERIRQKNRYAAPAPRSRRRAS